MNAIEMPSVTKRYRGSTVLDEHDLEIRSGDVFTPSARTGRPRPPRSRSSTVVAGSDLRTRIGIALQQTTAFERTTVPVL